MNHIKYFYEFYNYVAPNRVSTEFILQILCFDTIIHRSIHAHIFSFNTHFDSNLKFDLPSLSAYKSSNADFKKLLQHNIPFINIYKNFITCDIYKDNLHSLYDSNFIRFYFINFHFYDLYSFLYSFFPKTIVWDLNNNYNVINYFDNYLSNSHSKDDIIYTHKYTFDDTYLFTIKYFKYFISKFNSIIKDNSLKNGGWRIMDDIQDLCLDVPNYIEDKNDIIIEWFNTFYDVVNTGDKIQFTILYTQFIKDTSKCNISDKAFRTCLHNKFNILPKIESKLSFYSNIKRKIGL